MLKDLWFIQLSHQHYVCICCFYPGRLSNIYYVTEPLLPHIYYNLVLCLAMLNIFLNNFDLFLGFYAQRLSWAGI